MGENRTLLVTTQRESLVFLVRSCASAAVTLTLLGDPADRDSWAYRVTVSDARSSVESRDEVEAAETAGLVRCDEYRPLWLNWAAGLVALGRGTAVGDDAVLSFAVEEHQPIAALTFHSAGKTAWKILRVDGN